MRFAMLMIALGSSTLHGADWTPPKNPNPDVILNEAQADTRAGRYETALQKHVWFHENALSIEPALYGVRLSFALSYWLELAKQYPPALAKLKETRDKAKASVLAEKNVRESFHDLQSINEHLEEHIKTRTLFQLLDKKNPKIAKRVFDLAQPSLIKGQAYTLAGKYISPKTDFARMKEGYRQDKDLAKDPEFGAEHLEFANKQFTNDTTTLVALLTVNNRKKEAEEIAKLARAEWTDKSFHSAIEKALKGVVPDPWP